MRGEDKKPEISKILTKILAQFGRDLFQSSSKSLNKILLKICPKNSSIFLIFYLNIPRNWQKISVDFTPNSPKFHSEFTNSLLKVFHNVKFFPSFPRIFIKIFFGYFRILKIFTKVTKFLPFFKNAKRSLPFSEFPKFKKFNKINRQQYFTQVL